MATYTVASSDVLAAKLGGQQQGVIPPALAAMPAYAYNFKASNTPILRAKLQAVRAGTGRCRIVHVGDSTTAGPRALDATFVNGRINSASSVQANLLTAAGLPTSYDSVIASQGIIFAEYTEFNPRLTFTSGWAVGALASAGGLLFTSTTNNPAVLTVSKPVNKFEIFYYTRSSTTAAFTWEINSNGQSGAVSNQQPSGIGSLVLTSATPGAEALATPGLHTLTIRRSGSNIGSITQIIGYNTTVPAIDVVNAGWRGATTGDWNVNTNPESPRNAITYLAPDVTFINLGINNWRNDTAAPAQFSTDIQALITAAKVTGDVVLCAPFPSNTAGSAGDFCSVVNQATYITALYALANSNDCPLIDWTLAFGSWAIANANGYAYDNLHPTISGYAVMGSALSTFTRHVEIGS